MARDYTGRLTSDKKVMGRGSKILLLCIGIVFMLAAIVSPLVVLMSKDKRGDISYGDFIYQYNIKDGNVYYDIKKYVGQRTENVIIPSEYSGAPVVGILRGAFNGTNNEIHRNIKKLTFDTTSGGVSRIDSGAFNGLTSLTELHFTRNIKSLAQGAFTNCYVSGNVIVDDLGAFFNNENGIVYSHLAISTGAFVNSSSGGKLIVNSATGGIVPSEVLAAFGPLNNASCVLNNGVNIFDLGTDSFASFTQLQDLTVYAAQDPAQQNVYAKQNFEMAGCQKLKTLNILSSTYDSIDAGLSQKFVKAPIQTVNLGEGIKSVGALTFTGFDELKTINATNNETLDENGNVIAADGIAIDLNMLIFDEIATKKVKISSANNNVKLKITYDSEGVANIISTSVRSEITGTFMGLFEREKVQEFIVGSTVKGISGDNALTGLFTGDNDNYVLRFEEGSSILPSLLSDRMFGDTIETNQTTISKVDVFGPTDKNNSVHIKFNSQGEIYSSRRTYNGQAEWGDVLYNIIFDTNESSIMAMHAGSTSIPGFDAKLALYGKENTNMDPVTIGTRIKMPIDKNSRTNEYALIGWTQNSDGSGTRYYNADLEDNQITFNSSEWNVVYGENDEKTVTIYALWQKKTYRTITYVADFDSDVVAGQTAGNGNEQYYLTHLDYSSARVQYTAETTPTFGGGALITQNDKNVYVTGLPKTYQSGYSFKGWYVLPNGQGTKITASTPCTQDTTVYAYFVKALYSIVYHEPSDFGTGARTQNFYYTDNDFALKTAAEIGLNKPKGKEYVRYKTHKDIKIYEFTFNYADKGIENDAFIYRIWESGRVSVPELLFEQFSNTYTTTLEGQSVIDLTSPMFEGCAIHLYGEVETGSYTVTLLGNGGTFADSNLWLHQNDATKAISNNKILFGSKIGLFPIVRKVGYTFTNWQSSTGKVYDSDELLDSENLELSAQWAENRYTIKYAYETADRVETVENAVGFVTPGALSNGTAFAITGKNVVGWKIGDKNFALGATVTGEQLLKAFNGIEEGQSLDFNQAKAGNITIYAILEQKEYTLVLDANSGGVFGDLTDTGFTLNGNGQAVKDEKVKYQAYIYDTNKTLPIPVANSGMTFEGWYDNTAGTGITFTSSSIMTDAAGGTLTLYAKWSSTPYHFNFSTETEVGNDFETGQVGGSVAFKNMTNNNATVINGSEVYLGNRIQIVPSISSNGYLFHGLYAKLVDNQVGGDISFDDGNYVQINLDASNSFNVDNWLISNCGIHSIKNNANYYEFNMVAVFKAKEYTLNLSVLRPQGFSGAINGLALNLNNENAYTIVYDGIGDANDGQGNIVGVNATVVYGKSFNFVKYVNLSGETVYEQIDLPTFTCSNGSISSIWLIDKSKTVSNGNTIDENFFTSQLGDEKGRAIIAGNTIELAAQFDPYSIGIYIEKANGTSVDVSNSFEAYRLGTASSVLASASDGKVSIDGQINAGETVTLTLILKAGYMIKEIFKTETITSGIPQNYQPISISVGGNTQTIEFVMPSADVAIKLRVDAQTFNVTFDKNETRAQYGADKSVSMASQVYIYGQAQQLNENTFKFVGYDFLGWALDSNAAHPSYLNAETVTFNYTDVSQVVLYAVWAEKSYNFIYNGNGNTSGSVATQSNIVYTTENFELAENAFTKTGYTFMGWGLTQNAADYTSEQVVNVYNVVSSAYNGSGADNTNINLYAIWQVNYHQLTLNAGYGEFDATISGWTVSGDSKTATKNETVAYGAAISSLPQPTSAQYNFIKWVNQEGLGQVSTMPDDDLVLIAQWEIKTFDVILQGLGGSFTNTNGWVYELENGFYVAKRDNKINYGQMIGTAPTVTKTGFNFDYWWVDANSNNSVDADEHFSGEQLAQLVVTQNIVAKAQYAAITYNINYYYTTETKAEGTVYQTQSYTILTQFNAITPEARDGFDFIGWRVTNNVLIGNWQNGIRISAGAVIADPSNGEIGAKYGDISNDVSLVGEWDIISYELKLNANGGKFVGGAYDNLTEITRTSHYEYALGELELSSIGTSIAHAGYQFVSWNSAANGSGVTYTTASTMPNNDLTLYAQWTELEYNLTLYAGGGEFEATSGWLVENDETDPLNVKTNGKATKTSTIAYKATLGAMPTPIYVGYEFKGWFSQPNGSGDEFTQTSAMPVCHYDTGLVLYAHFEAMQIQVAFVANYELINSSSLTNFKAGTCSQTTATIRYNAPLGELPTWTTLPTCDGHTITFNQWHKEAACTTVVNNDTILNINNINIDLATKTASVYAGWAITVNRYAITFMSNGDEYGGAANINGNAQKTIYVTYNTQSYYVDSSDMTAASIPSAALVKTGYNTAFAGWKTSNGVVIFDASGVLNESNSNGLNLTSSGNWIITSELTLYAYFIVEESENTPYMISYMVEGLDGSYELLADSSVFEGSFTAGSYEFVSGQGVRFTGRTNARVRVNNKKLSALLGYDENEAGAATKDNGKFFFKKATATNNINDSEIAELTISPDGSARIYIFYARCNNSITLYTNGGNFTNSQAEMIGKGWLLGADTTGTLNSKASKNYLFGQEVNYAEDLDLPVPQRTGYTFNGWFSNIDGEGEAVSLSTMSGQNRALYAKWSAIEYRLTLSALSVVGQTNSGAIASAVGWTKDGETLYKTISFGSAYGFDAVSAPTIVAGENKRYSFDGWYTLDGTDGEWGSVVNSTDSYLTAGDQTLYAKFTISDKPLLILHLNGGVFDSSTSDQYFYLDAGQTLDMLASSSISRAGYGFDGWFTESSVVGANIVGQGTRYDSLGTMPNNETFNLYATWTRNELVFGNATLSGLIFKTQGESAAFAAATNGSGNYTYAVTSGTLPTGVTFDATNRKFVGAPSSDVGNYTVVVTATDSVTEASKTATMTIVIAPYNLENATIGDIIGQVYDDGAEVRPEPTVTAHNETLTKDTDFTYSYSNNINAGTDAVVTVTGVGNYTGTKSTTFEIARKRSATVSTTNLEYNGQPQTGVTGSNVNIIGDINMIDANEGESVYTCYVEPESNYCWADGTTNQVTKAWRILPKAVAVNWSDLSFTFTGAEFVPTATAADTGIVPVQLLMLFRSLAISEETENEEQVWLTVSGAASDLGTHTATAEISSVTNGRNKIGNYTLSNPTQEFSIVVNGIAKVYIITGLVYNGQMQTGATGDYVDFSVPTQGTNAGTYEFTATPQYGYGWDGETDATETREFSFSIAQFNLENASVSGIDATYEYTGTSITPTPTVTALGETLTVGQDYTVTYGSATANNTDVGENSGLVTITAVSSSNYTGTKTITFDIVPATYSLTVNFKTFKGTTQPTLSADGQTIALDASTTLTFAKSSTEQTSTSVTLAVNGNYSIKVGSAPSENGLNNSITYEWSLTGNKSTEIDVYVTEVYNVTIAANETEFGSVNVAAVNAILHGKNITINNNTLNVDQTAVTATPTTNTAQYVFVFEGWEVGGVALTDQQITSNLSVIANFSRVGAPYNLTLLSGDNARFAGDKTTLTSVRRYDESLGELELPNAFDTGYYFVEWNTVSDGSGTAYTADSKMPASNLTLYAVVVRAVKVTLTNNISNTSFDVYYAKINNQYKVYLPSNITGHMLNKGGNITSIVGAGQAIPTREHYTFGGYKFTDNNGEFVNAAGDFVVTGLNASTDSLERTAAVDWVPDTYTITIIVTPSNLGTVSGNGLTNQEQIVLSGIPHDSAITVSGSAITINGIGITAQANTDAYFNIAFEKWVDANDNDAVTTTVSGATTFKAVFTQDGKIVGLNLHGATGVTSVFVKNGTAEVYSDGSSPIVGGLGNANYVATKATDDQYVYTFTGWYSAQTGGTKIVNTDGTFAVTDFAGIVSGEKWYLSATGDLYAQFDSAYREFSVTFNRGARGTFENHQAEETITKTYTYGEALGSTVPVIVANAGYTHAGWQTGSTVIETANIANHTITAEQTLTAVYTLNSYNLTVSANNCTRVELKATNNETYTFDATNGWVQEIPFARTINLASAQVTYVTGYEFGSWSITGATISGDQFTMPNGEVTLTLTTSCVGYTLTYNADGGTLAGDATQTFTVEESIIAQAAPTKPGYSFGGWKPTTTAGNWETGTTYAAGETIGPGKCASVTLKAVWAEVEYDLTIVLARHAEMPATLSTSELFDSIKNGATTLEDSVEGRKISELTISSTVVLTVTLKKGCWLTGVVADSGIITYNSTNNDTLTADGKVQSTITITGLTQDTTLTLTAKMAQFNIKFINNETPSQTVVCQGKSLFNSEEALNSYCTNSFTYAHHTFVNWVLDTNGNGTIDSGEATTFAANATAHSVAAAYFGTSTRPNNFDSTTIQLIATWTPNVYNISVTVPSELSGIVNAGAITISQTLYTATYGSTYKFNATGESNNIATIVLSDVNNKIYQMSGFDIYVGGALASTLDCTPYQAGETPSQMMVNFTANQTIFEALAALNVTNGSEIEFRAKIAEAATIVYWAKYSQTINLEYNDAPTTGFQSVPNNTTLSDFVDSCFEAETGFEVDFVNYNGGNVYPSGFAGVMVTAITSSEASRFKVYYKRLQYDISYYDVGGGEFTGSHNNPSTYIYGKAVTLEAASKVGYIFVIWQDANGAVVTAISATDTGDKTLYAQWAPMTFNVTLDKNGGTGGTNSVTATYGQPMPNINKPTRAGYSFLGYSTVQDTNLTDNAMPGTQYYNANGISANDWNNTAGATLFAGWKANTYTITYNLKGGVWISGSPNPTHYTYGVGATLPTADDVRYTGYSFNGWYTDSNCTSSAETTISTIATGNKTFYAGWSVNYYNIIWKDYEGNILRTDSVEYNTRPSYGQAPAWPEDAYFYTFVGWEAASSGIVYQGRLPQATDNETYKARYNRFAKSFEVTLETIPVDPAIDEPDPYFWHSNYRYSSIYEISNVEREIEIWVLKTGSWHYGGYMLSQGWIGTRPYTAQSDSEIFSTQRLIIKIPANTYGDFTISIVWSWHFPCTFDQFSDTQHYVVECSVCGYQGLGTHYFGITGNCRCGYSRTSMIGNSLLGDAGLLNDIDGENIGNEALVVVMTSTNENIYKRKKDSSEDS